MSGILARLLPFVPPHLARKLVADPERDEQVRSEYLAGAILFADISGFTPLTEQFAAGGKEGPEALSRLLNLYFNRLIALLAAESGEVVKFSGDALMVLFPAERQTLGEAVRRAQQAAEAMQTMLGESDASMTPVGAVQLSMKIGIGVGQVLAMEVGGLLGRWEYVVAGDPIRQATASEGQAQPGEVVLSPEAQEVVLAKPLAPRRIETVGAPALDRMESVEQALRRFVPGAVLGWLETDEDQLLGVLRPMTVLFIGIKDFDFTADRSLDTFHQLVRNLQRSLYRFEGSLNKVSVDDKGTVIMALFGAPPLAHEDDAVRGVKAALEIQALAQKDDLPLAVGVTTGPVFAGTVGGEVRFEYTVMGDSVNLAARLMKAAGPGNILCDLATHRGASGKVRMDTLEPVRVKGKQDRVRVFRPNDMSLTSKIVSGAFRPPPSMLGREHEARLIGDCLARMQQGAGAVLLVEGGAGMGKSRLLLELQIQAKLLGVRYLGGLARSTERQVPLRAWRDIFEAFFELNNVADPKRRRAQVQQSVTALVPSALPRLALLSDWLNLGYDAGTQEITIDAEQRAHSQVELLCALLMTWTATRPLVIALDDGQWLDIASWRLALKLVEGLRVTQAPLLLTLAGRPMERGSEESKLRSKLVEGAQTAVLEALSRDNLVLMVADRLRLLPGKVPARVVNFIHQRSEGAPFVAEELLRAMLDQGMIEVWKDEKTQQYRCRVRGELTARTESLPGSVRGLILSRIDRLSGDQQVTLKVASVFGRTFSFEALAHILEVGNGFDGKQVLRHLDSFADMEFIDVANAEPHLVYRFRHRVTQEVAYDSMLFSYRRELHLAVAQWFERTYAGDRDWQQVAVADLQPQASSLTLHLSELASHYQRAGDAQRELIYDVLAGRTAARLFQNAQAERFLTRALDILPDDDLKTRFALLADREAIYTAMARRGARKDDLKAMQEVARQLEDNGIKAQVAVRQAIYQFTYGRHQAARDLAESAIELAQAENDKGLEAQARRWLGGALQAAGSHQAARQQMEAALVLAQSTEDHALIAVISAQLARFAEKRGEFKLCLKYCEQAIEMARQGGYLATEAVVLRRMASVRLAKGELDLARQLAEQATDIQQRIGDRRQQAVTIDLMGRIAMAEGDYAQGQGDFERSLGLRQEIQDRKGQHRSLMLLGQACFHMGAYEKARLCYSQALDDADELEMAYDQAEINARLVLLEHCVGDNEKAKRHGLQAAKTLSALNDPPLLATALTHLGHALGELGEYDSAAVAYGNAQRIRQGLGQTTLLMETVAGSAQLDFKRGRATEALDKVDAIVQHFGDRRITGVAQPFRIYQTCFEVLQHMQDARAGPLIERAYSELTESANAISDAHLRESFLESVLENRAVAYYYHGVVDANNKAG